VKPQRTEGDVQEKRSLGGEKASESKEGLGQKFKMQNP